MLNEAISFDMEENGVPEYLLWDTDNSVGFEYLYVDSDQNGRWNLRRIVAGSNLDLITRAQNFNLTGAMMAAFRSHTGQSLLFPSFPSPY